MKKNIALAAGIALGLCFLFASVMVLLNLGPKPKPSDVPPAEFSPKMHFMAAIGPTGYIKFVKSFELVGALVVMYPRTRNIGLLLLGPVIVNIIAFHLLVDDPYNMLINPLLYVIIPCALYLLWDARQKFSGLLN
jgi:putative oxidoreductase